MTDLDCVDEWANAVEAFTAERAAFQKNLHEGEINRESFDMSVRKLNKRMLECWDEMRVKCPTAPL